MFFAVLLLVVSFFLLVLGKSVFDIADLVFDVIDLLCTGIKTCVEFDLLIMLFNLFTASIKVIKEFCLLPFPIFNLIRQFIIS